MEVPEWQIAYVGSEPFTAEVMSFSYVPEVSFFFDSKKWLLENIFLWIMIQIVSGQRSYLAILPLVFVATLHKRCYCKICGLITTQMA